MTAPWTNPPTRAKTLSQRRSETKARRAQRWGQRVAAAEAEGARAVVEAQFDWARSSLSRLPGPAQERAWQALAETIQKVREEHAQ